MIESKNTFRMTDSSQFTYHDRIFDNKINSLVHATDEHFTNMMYREALKTGFYDLQAARDHYRDITAATEYGMNWQLLEKFIEVSSSLICLNCLWI